MKKFLTIPTLALSVAVLAGCGGGDTLVIQVPTTTEQSTTTTSTTIPPTMPPTTLSRATLDSLYVDSIRTQIPGLWMLDDNGLLEFGYLVCGHFQNGGTNDDLIQTIIDVGVDSNATEQMMLDLAGASGVAVAILCSEYEWKLG